MSDSDKPDRYVSFTGIDCAGNSARVIDRLLAHIERPERSNPFWEQFKVKVAEAKAGEAGKPDLLYLVCSHVYYISDLFETHGDDAGLDLLHQIEDECC